MTPESKVKAKVKRLLAEHGRGVYSFMPVQHGMGAPALDFYLCAYGIFLAVETKAGHKKITPRQQATRDLIEEAGGRVFVVYDDDSLLALRTFLAFCAGRRDRAWGLRVVEVKR